jgi:hypothetical protein
LFSKLRGTAKKEKGRDNPEESQIGRERGVYDENEGGKYPEGGVNGKKAR